MSVPFVAIVGTINRDVIRTPAGRTHESLGGILYNALTLGALLEGTGIGVRPVGRLGAEDRDAARRLLAAFSCVDPDGLIVDGSGTNSCVLEYDEAGGRREEVALRVDPLHPRDLAPLLGARAVLVNMISGRDVTPSTLAPLRRATDARFFLDVQALARTLESPRVPRPVPAWREWCALFDVVRGNELEIAHFAGERRDEARAVAALLDAGPSEVLVTRGASGGTRYWRDGSVRAETYEAWPAPEATDTTGCGDAFLSGVCAAHAFGMAPDAALRLGAYVAAEVACLAGLESMRRLAGVRDRAREADSRLAALPGAPPTP
jgi:sugar/nucleoside kinase (ribokinase family)